MINKKIHYCWFGGAPLPEYALKCINSWKKYLPDYEIIEWNEDNFDVNCTVFTSQAYESRKFAFVSDYARYYILSRQGGIYFDTDVELIKPLDDLISDGPFHAFESIGSVNSGLGMAAEPNMDFFKDVLRYYEQTEFIKPNGKMNLKTVVHITSDILRGYGLVDSDTQQFVAGMHIYPTDYFNPMNYDTKIIHATDNTRAVHHYAGSWCEPESLEIKLKAFISTVIGKSATTTIRKFTKKFKRK